MSADAMPAPASGADERGLGWVGLVAAQLPFIVAIYGPMCLMH